MGIIINLFSSTGALPVALLVGPEGPATQPAAGGPDQALRQPEERRQRHQKPQVVLHHRLDRHLPAQGQLRIR